jgi:hypothetical protein
MTLVLHVGYRHIVAEIAHTRPGYIGTEGLFLLGFTAPADPPEDFDGTVATRRTGHVRPHWTIRARVRASSGAKAASGSDAARCPKPEAAADVVATAHLTAFSARSCRWP